MFRPFEWAKSVLCSAGWVAHDHSEYAQSDYVESLIADALIFQVINDDDDDRIVDVDLRQKMPSDSRLGYGFKSRWANFLPRNCPLTLFFPNHPDTNMQILHTDKLSSLANMDKAIHKRLAESKIQAQTHRHIDTLLMAVACGKYIYRIWGIDKNHNVYLYWLTHLNKFNSAMGGRGPIQTMVPTIAELDGDGGMLNTVPLNFKPSMDTPDRIQYPLDLNAHKCTYIQTQNGGETLFNLERDARQVHQRRVVTAGDAVATNDVRSRNAKSNVLDTIRAEDFPLDEVSSHGDDAGDYISRHPQQRHYSDNGCFYSDDEGDDDDDGDELILSRDSPPRCRPIASESNGTLAEEAFVPDEEGFSRTKNDNNNADIDNTHHSRSSSDAPGGK